MQGAGVALTATLSEPRLQGSDTPRCLVVSVYTDTPRPGSPSLGRHLIGQIVTSETDARELAAKINTPG
jgi:hypothetical protein